MIRPILTVLDFDNAKIYGEWIAAMLGVDVVGDPVEIVLGLDTKGYGVALSDGCRADMWLESGEVVGEA